MSIEIYANEELDVFVESFELLDHPARVVTQVRIKEQTFFSRITYHSIPRWSDVWGKLSPECCHNEVLGALIAWDCMRFLALGGSRLVLCDGVALAEDVKAMWRHCFLNQFGEWRYRNKIGYPPGYPCVVSNEFCGSTPRLSIENAHAAVNQKWLLTNGGGKDTLVGILLLRASGLDFDVYEGALPLGGEHSAQRALLRTLREACSPQSGLVEVTIEDDFFTSSDAVFANLGVLTEHYLSDFAVGHTANYVGYFPVILHGGYSGVWFNIEASADRVMATWNGERINHQWCKSREYQELCTQLFSLLCGRTGFSGFASTLRGLHDSVIYSIACSKPELLQLAHSCNISKPWCRRCPKCCFSYLMMASYNGEDYAKRVVGVDYSLFSCPDNQTHWRDLLDPAHVAWECVPSHEECHEALDRCVSMGVYLGPLLPYAKPGSDNRFNQVSWRETPANLRSALHQLCSEAGLVTSTDVLIVGAGQTGISLSAVLADHGINHVVLEASEVGSSWRHRWDSFQLNTPNRTIALPGYTYDGDDPDGFLTASQVVELLRSYVHDRRLPVIEKCPVVHAEKIADHFIVSTASGSIRSRCLVVAAGEYKHPRMPRVPLLVPDNVKTIHSGRYSAPHALDPGSILVVGGGQSGAQIVEDLIEAGQRVYWSISDRPSNTRRLRGKDFMEWWEIGGIIHRHVSQDPGVLAGLPNALHEARSREFPLVSGKGGNGRGRSVSLHRMAKAGVTMLGRLQGISDGKASFQDVRPQIARAIAATRAEHKMLQRIADEYYAASATEGMNGDDSLVPDEVYTDWNPDASPLLIDLEVADIRNIIFATGFVPDWGWLNVEGIFDEHGYPLGDDGISTQKGLYFMGLFNIQRLSSTCLCNGGRDAFSLLPEILARIQTPEFCSQQIPPYREASCADSSVEESASQYPHDSRVV